jgi:hypothetical protein
VSGPAETELRVGDEAELTLDQYPEFVAKGTLRMDGQGCCLSLGPWPIVTNGDSVMRPDMHLKVTKLAPRPIYANHDREEPVDGDVVRDAATTRRTTWLRAEGRWYNTATARPDSELPKSLILLVDGDTGLPAAPMQPSEPVQKPGFAQDPNRPGYGPATLHQGV